MNKKCRSAHSALATNQTQNTKQQGIISRAQHRAAANNNKKKQQKKLFYDRTEKKKKKDLWCKSLGETFGVVITLAKHILLPVTGSHIFLLSLLSIPWRSRLGVGRKQVPNKY